MKWAIATVATVALAIALARRRAAESAPWTGSGFNLSWLPGPASDAEPVDQLPSLFESAIVNASPMTHIPPSNAPTQQAQNLRAFLDMIAFAEGTDRAGDPYRVCYGYRHTIRSLADHPAITGEWGGERLPDAMCAGAGLGPGCVSTAAGRYQIIRPTWRELKADLNLPDFGPASQDAAAVELIRRRGALNDVYAGRIAQAIDKVAKVWASLPGAGYAQPERKLSNLLAAYGSAGGITEA